MPEPDLCPRSLSEPPEKAVPADAVARHPTSLTDPAPDGVADRGLVADTSTSPDGEEKSARRNNT